MLPSPMGQDATLQRMEEIYIQVVNLREQQAVLPTTERAQIVSQLVDEWMALHRKTPSLRE